MPGGQTYYYDLEITLNDLADVDQTEDLKAILTTNFTLGDPRMYIFYTLKVDPAGGSIGDTIAVQEYKLLKGEG